MALIKCEDCGKEVSSRAQACPWCGCPVEHTAEENETIAATSDAPSKAKKKVSAKILVPMIGVFLVAAIACVLLTGKPENPFEELMLDDLSKENIHSVLGEPDTAGEVVAANGELVVGFRDRYQIDDFFGSKELCIDYDEKGDFAYAWVSWIGCWGDIPFNEAEKKIEDIIGYFEKSYGKSLNDQVKEAGHKYMDYFPVIIWVVDNKFEVRLGITDLKNPTTGEQIALSASQVSFRPLTEVTSGMVERLSLTDE